MHQPDRANPPRQRVSTARGRLRIYLGAGAGVGKTFALLTEGHLRAQHGTDVVLACGRPGGAGLPEGLLEGLEVIPSVTVPYRGWIFEEIDLDAVLARRPEVALLDDLAHTNSPGSRHSTRWQDVAELLDAGIDVICTVDVRHLESLNDVVEAITGVRHRKTVPDAIVRAADEAELVGISTQPNAGASALHALALRWLADKLRQDRQSSRADNRASAGREGRERVLVALGGHADGETLIRRAARLAARSDADLIAVHISPHGDLTQRQLAALDTQRRLIQAVGGTYHRVIGDDISAALLTLARAVNATQLVVGGRHHSRFSALLPRTRIRSQLIRGSAGIDVHLVNRGDTVAPRSFRIGRAA
jgi:two-component system, OmpR family, sensor histidine kinase KdpD